MGKKGPLWWRESDWLLRGSSAANQILLRHSGPILSNIDQKPFHEGQEPFTILHDKILQLQDWVSVLHVIKFNVYMAC